MVVAFGFFVYGDTVGYIGIDFWKGYWGVQVVKIYEGFAFVGTE